MYNSIRNNGGIFILRTLTVFPPEDLVKNLIRLTGVRASVSVCVSFSVANP